MSIVALIAVGIVISTLLEEKRRKRDERIGFGVFSHIDGVRLTSDRGLIGSKKERWHQRRQVHFKNGAGPIPVDVIKLPKHPEYVEVVSRNGKSIARAAY